MPALAFKDDLVTRREAIRRVSALFGGVALIGQSAWLTGCATAQRSAADLFSESDVTLLAEVADTILPETKTPGAKAAGVGPFIAMMVADTYDTREQDLFREGLETLEREAAMQNGGGFMASSPAQRLALLERLDREAIEYMRGPSAADRPHYFRMIKELTLLGYFTSEIGYTQAQRYVETPGRFEPATTYTVGDKAWAPHA
jgi:hypothetical protein